MEWVLGILVAAIVLVMVFAAVQKPQKRKSDDLRKRYAIDPSQAVSIPLADERPPQPVPTDNGTPTFEPAAPIGGPGSNWLRDLVREDADPPFAVPPPRAVTGRMVQTPDGEQILTTPPFALRSQMVSNRLGRFVNALSKRLPPWVIACPRVRLEALVIPTPPDGRDAEDWSQWRRRVRLRAVDVVLCDRRTWKPFLAIMLKPATRYGRKDGTTGTVHALILGGGQDRMIDEVLTHAGLTLIHAAGKIAEDWPLIEPYVEQAIMKSQSEDEFLAATDAANGPPDTEAAVNLLRMDGEKGWLFE